MLNKRKVKQALRGYQLANKVIEAERRAWLERLTFEQARAIFDQLHQDADRWKKEGGNLAALERRRIKGSVQGRQVYIRLARRNGLL